MLAYGDGKLINDYTDRMGYCICKHLGNDFYYKNTSGAQPKLSIEVSFSTKIQFNLKDTLKTCAYAGVIGSAIIPILIFFVKMFGQKIVS